MTILKVSKFTCNVECRPTCRLHEGLNESNSYFYSLKKLHISPFQVNNGIIPASFSSHYILRIISPKYFSNIFLHEEE